MPNKHEEQLLSSLSAEERQQRSSQSSTQLLEQHEKEGFMIVGNEEQGYFVALGKLRLTDGHESKEECERRIESRDWELLLNLILSLNNAYEQFQKQANNLQAQLEANDKTAGL